MAEKKKPETHPPFFEDESEEPTIVWVRPPRGLRGFTRQVHFLHRLHMPAVAGINEDLDDDDDDDTCEEDTRA